MYESLLEEIEEGVTVKEKPLEYGLKGVYRDSRIIIKKGMSNAEKACVLAEELGHHYTSTGNILDQTKSDNRKQERIAREWAYRKLVPLCKIVDALGSGIRNYYELAQYLGVTDEFLQDAIERYKNKTVTTFYYKVAGDQ